MNTDNRKDSVTLEVLQAIDGQSNLTQRHLADRLGIALGLANAYLRRCVRKGLIKVQTAPANRYFYYLTPQGFAEKSRLTALYLRDSFDFYRRASASVNRTLEHCARADYRVLALAGASELAEITLIRAREHPVEVVSVFDPALAGERFLDLPVISAADGLRGVDAAIVTSIRAAADTWRTAAQVLGPERVLIPDLLGVRPEVMQ